MKFLLYYLVFIIPALALWHLIMSDQKRLKNMIFCPICQSVLEMKGEASSCAQCDVPSWVVTPQKESSGVHTQESEQVLEPVFLTKTPVPETEGFPVSGLVSGDFITRDRQSRNKGSER